MDSTASSTISSKVISIPNGAIDVTPAKDGGVWKLILKEGGGETMPSIGDTCLIQYKGNLADGTKFDSSEDLEFALGSGKVIKGLDIAVATMKKGEVSEIIVHSEYGYGVLGLPPLILPSATLIFEIRLIDFEIVWKNELDEKRSQMTSSGGDSEDDCILPIFWGFKIGELTDVVDEEKLNTDGIWCLIRTGSVDNFPKTSSILNVTLLLDEKQDVSEFEKRLKYFIEIAQCAHILNKRILICENSGLVRTSVLLMGYLMTATTCDFDTCFRFLQSKLRNASFGSYKEKLKTFEKVRDALRDEYKDIFPEKELIADTRFVYAVVKNVAPEPPKTGVQGGGKPKEGVVVGDKIKR